MLTLDEVVVTCFVKSVKIRSDQFAFASDNLVLERSNGSLDAGSHGFSILWIMSFFLALF